jgi:uncharacterized protein (TIGR03437 family)
MQKLKLFAGIFLTALVFPAFCSAQTISIVSGDGQLVCPDCAGGPFAFAPLVVQVNNAAGQPEANATVMWTPTQQGLPSVTASTTTNSAGQASYTFTGLAFFFGFNFLPATVVAAIPTGSVTFMETSALPSSGGGPGVFATIATQNGTAPNLTGAVGATSSTIISVSVYSFYGPVPGIAVQLQAGTTGPSVGCVPALGQPAGAQPGIVFTDSTGTALCTPVFGGTIGTGSYTIYAGGKLGVWGPATLTVTAGAPAALKYISGNNQSVNPGVRAPLALTAEVTDLGGNPASDAAVTWSVSPAGDATLSNQTPTSGTNGEVSAFVTPTVGPVQVTVALAGKSSISYVFNVNVNLVITALQYVSGNAQQAKEGAAFTDPLIVQVNDSAVALAGATVNFAVTSGSATLSGPSATTNAQGQASVSATAGNTAGPVVVTASVASAECTGGTCSYAFDLTVIPNGPVITSVVNAAGFKNSPLAASPCSLVTIYGVGLATGLQGVVAPFVAPQMQVASVSVQFGGVSAPILYVANSDGVESVSAQVPCQVAASSAVPPATVPMVVTVDNAPSAPFPVPVTPFSPGIFQFTDTDGAVRAVVVRQDGTFITLANPARPGDTLRMFVTGLGQTTPGLFTNEFDPLVEVNNEWVPQALPVNAGVLVGVNNGGVLVLSAQYAYGMVGVYEVDFQLPENTVANNNAPFDVVAYQGNIVAYGNGSLIPIQ